MISNSVEEEPMYQRRLLPWTIAASFALHGVAYASLTAAPPPAMPSRHSPARFEIVEQPKPAPRAALPEPPKPQLEKAPKPRSKPEPPATPLPPATPAPAATPPPAEPPVSTGVTLAADGAGVGFAMPLGSGGSLDPAGRGSPAPLQPQAPAATKSRAPLEPALVAVGDLSAKPAPPPLAAALERNYPADARRRGSSGSAKVRARIDPDGVVRRVSLLDESAAGFGEACSHTLTGSRWAAPKDKVGHPVATEIRYTCRFVVAP
jgi:TonB family protein